jgi:hypothetical protein
MPQDKLKIRELASVLKLAPAPRHVALNLGPHDEIAAFEPPDFTDMLDAMSWGVPPEIARLVFKTEDNGLHMISLTLFANGTFAVGSHTSFATNTFVPYMEAFNRALHIVLTYGLTPRYRE